MSLEPVDSTPEDKELAKKIAGDDYMGPDPQSMLVFQLSNLQRIVQRRQELLDNAVTSTQVMEIIGCEHRSTVRDRRLVGTLIGLGV